MDAVLSEILDRLADIDDARQKDDNHDAVHEKFESLYDFVSCEEDEAGRMAWLKSSGVL